MSWFRRQRVWGGRLALLALALQLGLSFGHVHAGAVVPSSVVQHENSTPDSDDDHAHLNDICAICATIHLLSAGDPPSAPAPTARIAVTTNLLFFASIGFVPPSYSGLFRARAPPQA